MSLHQHVYEAFAMAVLNEKGKLHVEDIDARVLRSLNPHLTEDELDYIDSGEQRWHKKLRFSLSDLKREGFLDNPERGYWCLTSKGKRWCPAMQIVGKALLKGDDQSPFTMACRSGKNRMEVLGVIAELLESTGSS